MTVIIILIYIIFALTLISCVITYKRLKLRYDIMRMNYPKELQYVIHYLRCSIFGAFVGVCFTVPMYILPDINDNLMQISASFVLAIFINYFLSDINNILNNIKL